MAEKLRHIDRSAARYDNLYNTRGLSIRQIASELGVSPSLVRKDLRTLAIARRPSGRHKHVAVAERTKSLYVDLYLTKRFSIRQIAHHLGVCSDVVFKDLKRFAITTRPVSPTEDEFARRELIGPTNTPPTDAPPEQVTVQRSRKPTARASSGTVRHRTLDTSFFDHIDSEIKAYALGLIWTDGSIRLGPGVSVRIVLQDTDGDVLEAIATAMCASPVRRMMPPRSKGKSNLAELELCSRELVLGLMRLGMCANKSRVLPCPIPPPPAYATAFVRGAIDGDGSLFRPDYPTIAFYNHNPHLRAIVVDCWERITGHRPKTYIPKVQGRCAPRVCDIGHRACQIAKALYLDDATIFLERKRAIALAFQDWRKDR